MLDEWTRDAFAANLHTSFLILFPSHTLSLTLVELTDQPSSPRLETFSLLFRGPADTLLPQGMYAIRHDQMGTAELFLVPVARHGDGLYYEAVFNRYRR